MDTTLNKHHMSLRRRLMEHKPSAKQLRTVTPPSCDLPSSWAETSWCGDRMLCVACGQLANRQASQKRHLQIHGSLLRIRQSPKRIGLPVKPIVGAASGVAAADVSHNTVDTLPKIAGKARHTSFW